MFKNLFATLLCASLTCALSAQQIQLEFETTDVSCAGGSNGKIKIVSTTNGLTFDWADLPGTNDPIQRTDLPAGTYSVTANSAAGGPAATASVTLSEPAPLATNVVVQSVSCFGGSDGAILLNVSGGTPPYNYNWADLPGTNNPGNRAGLPDGVYSVVVTDFFGCTVAPISVALGSPTPIAASANTTPASSGQVDGSVDLTVSGGTGPYQYAWSGDGGFAANTQDLAAVPTGTYACLITDANGCTSVVTAVVGTVSGATDASRWDGPLQVFPNPASSQLTLRLHVPVAECNILVVNALGAIQTFNNTASDTFTAQWEVQNWPAGVYCLDIRHGQQRVVRQVVVMR